MTDYTIRNAYREDIPIILQFVKELAEYERLLDEVSATPELLEKWLFDMKTAEAIICECDGRDAGFALFFHNFSTFLGKAGIYIEDIFVRPEFRGRGLGKALLKRVAQIAVEKSCGRLEWSVLDWNTPSIAFYRSCGAVPMSEWTMYRMTGDTLTAFAQE